MQASIPIRYLFLPIHLRVFFSILILSLLTCPSTWVLAQENNSVVTQCQDLEDDDAAEAISLAEQALTNSEVLLSAEDRYRLLGCQGWAHALLGNTAKASRIAHEIGHGVVNHSMSDVMKTDLLRRAGSVLHRAGDRKAATDWYVKAMELAIEAGADHKRIPILINLAVVHSETDQNQQAISYYQETLDLIHATDDQRYLAPVLFNLSLTLLGEERYQDALQHLLSIEKMMNDQWPQARQSQVYHGIYAAYEELGNQQHKHAYLQKALQSAREIGPSQSLATAL